MNYFYKFLAICLLLPLFQSNASVSDEHPKPKSNTHKPLDCGIPAPTIVNYGCLDLVWQKIHKRFNHPYVQSSETPIKVYLTTDGGYIFATESRLSVSTPQSFQIQYNYFVTKTDGNGNKLWSKLFNTTSNKERLVSFVPTNDGGYMLGGYTDAGVSGMKTTASQGLNDIWLVKIDADGNKIWDKSFGGSGQDNLSKMIATSDGGFLLVSSSTSPVSGDKTEAVIGGTDAWVIKINASGIKEWDKVFGGTADETPRALAETDDGYLLGSISSSGVGGNKTATPRGNSDFWVVKMDLTGTKIWDNAYGGVGNEWIETIHKNADGSFILAGSSNSSVGGDKSLNSRGLYDTWIVKISVSGTKIWDKTIGGNNDDFLSSVTANSAGNLIFNIQSYSGISGDKKRAIVIPNGTDQWLFEINSDGNMLWEKYLNGQVYHRPGDILIHNNHLIILGMPDVKTIGFGIDSETTGLKKVSYCTSQAVNSATICKGKNTVISAEGCSSGIIKWSNNVHGASQPVSPSTTQNYEAVCLSADSTCLGDSSAVFTVNVNASDDVTISPAGNVELTCGQSQTLTATGCANGTISWSNGQTGSSLNISPQSSQIVNAICTMPNGCVSESNYVGITVYKVLAPTISGLPTPSQPVCAGVPLTLTTNCDGGTANWSGGLTGNSITITPTQTFIVRVACTYPNGCVSDSSYRYPNDTIKVVARPATPIIANYTCLKKVWDKRFGGSQDDGLIKTIKLNDGYLLVGQSNSSISGDKSENNRGVSRDYWVVKIDNIGNKIWDKTYGGASDDYLTDVVKLSDGGFILAGQSDSGIGGDKTEASKGLADYWIVKIDANGNKVWDKTYGGDNYEQAGVYVRETNDGLLVGGTSISGISGNKTVTMASSMYHFWILKLDTQGNKIWEKQFGGTNNHQYLTAVEIGNNNEYLLLGYSGASANTGNKTSANKGGPDNWLIKIDASGNKIWDKSYGGNSSDYPYSMVILNDGKITMAGSTSSTVSNGSDVSRRTNSNNYNHDAWIIQVDSDGNKIWDKTYGTTYYDDARSITLTNQNRYIISMRSGAENNKNYDLSQNSRGEYDYWIVELDASGNKLWDRSFGGLLSENISNVIEENNSLLISGSSYSGISGDKSQNSRGESDYWLVKMNICQPTISSSTTICKNDSTFLTAQNCPNASTVKWSNGETVQTISVKPSVTTTYKAICISTESGFCQSDSSLVFTVNVTTTPPPTLTATKTSICIGENTTISASGCSGTYGWTGGSTSTSITVNPTTTKIYKVTCTDNITGCKSDSASITITVNPIPAIPNITTVSQNVCQGESKILTASGCSNGIYQWTGGLTGSSISVSPTVASAYRVACKVGNCVSDSSASRTLTVITKPSPPIVQASNYAICQGGLTTISGGGCNGGTVLWSSGATGSLINLTLNSSVTYKAVCDLNGCRSDSSSALSIIVSPKPTQPTISNTGSTTICQGTSITLNASACAGGTLGWTGGLTGSSITISSLGTRNYKVACTVNGCTSDSSLVRTVQITAKPSTPTITPPQTTTLCQGTTLGLSASGCSGGTLGWTGGLTGSSINISSVGTRTFRVACNINGCTSDSSSAVTITVNPKPSQPTINQASQTICSGQSLNLTVTPVGGNTYGWTGGLTGSNINVSPITTKIYKVAALANGCASDSSSNVTITVQATSSSPTTTSANICQGGTLTTGNGLKSTIPNCSGGGSSSITATYSGGTVGYDGGSSSGSNPTATISGMSNTIMKVKVSITWQKKGGSGNAYSCATAPSTNPYHNETSFKVKAPDGITIIDLIYNGTFATGSTSSLVTTVFEDGFPTVSSSGPVSGTFSPASPLSGFNGKIPNGVWTLLPNDSGGGDPLCVSGFAVTVTAGSVAVPSTITWWDAQTSGNQVGTGAEYLPTTNTFASGTYTYYAQASCTGLCPSLRIAATLTVSAKPVAPIITPPANSTICQGSSITLSATGCTGGTFAWTGGLTGSSISVSPSSTKAYKVACTLNTCTSDSSSAVTINVTSSPVFTLSSNKTSVCSGDSATLTVTGCTGTILWSNGATTTIIKVSPTTNTTYTATCSIGTCSSNQSVSITPLTAPNVTASGTLQCGQTVTLTANNVQSGSNIQWRKDGIDIAGATSTTYSANVAGRYDFKVGATFSTQVYVNTDNNMISSPDVQFLNENIGYHVVNSVIRKTINGGITWNDVYTLPNIKSIFFIDINNGWAITNSIILRTTNGGSTWSSYSANAAPFNGLSLLKIYFKDSNNGIVVANDKIFLTNNGGVTWNYGSNLSGIPNKFVAIPYSNNMIWVGKENNIGVIKKSTDNGLNWTTILSESNVDEFNNIQFVNQNVGWATSSNGIIKLYKTTNGGNSWALISSNSLGNPAIIDFVSEQVGYIFGVDRIHKTTNGGVTWNLFRDIYLNDIQGSGASVGLFISLDFISEDNGWYSYQTLYENPSKTVLKKVSTTQCPTIPITIINNCCLSPIPTVTPINPTFCNGGNVKLTASGCAGTYTWTGGLTGSSITVSVAKTYKVTCRMNNCNSDSASVSVTNTVVIAPTIALGGEVCTNNLPAKIWDKSISTPSGSSINALVKTNDGGMFTVIREPSTTTIAKLDATGTTVWSRALFSVPAGTVKINAAVATTDGGYLLAGKSNSASVGGDVSTPARLGLYNNPTDDFWILKIDANGVKQWDKRYGGNQDDEANDIIQTSDGGYLLGGITQSDPGGDITESGTPMENNYWSLKIDANGLKQWDRRFIPQYLTALSGGATLKTVQNASDGGYLLGGYSKPPFEPINNTVQTNDYFVVKLNASGGKQWERLFNNNNAEDYLNSMQPTSDGGFLLVGNTSTANGNIWLVKINSSGARQWSKEFGGSNIDDANTIVTIPGENNFLIGGTSSSGINGDKTEASKGMLDLWVIKVKSDGTKIWDKTIGGSGPDYIFKTTFDSSNDIVLGAFTASPTSEDRTGNGPGAWFVKIASNCPPQTSTFITLGDSLTLKANPCAGTINWSNGMTGSSIVIKPTINTVYTATCSTTCVSPASLPFSVTVSAGICETIKSGSWTDPTTWSANRVPTSTDDVIINVGHTVTNSEGTIRAKSLNYRGGTLQISSTSNLILGN